jgi:hypothetical protein
LVKTKSATNPKRLPENPDAGAHPLKLADRLLELFIINLSWACVHIFSDDINHSRR